MSADVRGPIVGWVVDVQVDFMVPAEQGGRLYVRELSSATDVGATQVLPAIARTVAWLRERAAVLVFTGDWHRDDDAEIDAASPDFATTYPPHCMGASADASLRGGAALLPEVAPDDPLVLDRDADAAEGARVAREALATRRPVFIHKSRFSVFEGNAGTDAFVRTLAERLGTPEFVACGVARDVCVTQAVDGLQDRGHHVTVVRDATWGLGLEAEPATLARWEARGARLVTSAALAG